MAHLLHGSIAFSTQFHSKLMQLSPFWQQFKNSVTLKDRPFHSQPPIHFHSISDFLTAWFIKISSSTSCSVHICPCCARLTGVIISMGVHLTNVKFSATFHDTVQSHSIITTHMYQLAINVVHPRELNDTTDLFIRPGFQYYYHCTSTYSMNSS